MDRLLTFSPDQPRHCVTITIINDEECEDRPNEVFSVVIRGDDPRARLRPSSVTVTIDDAGLYGTTVADPDCCESMCPSLLRTFYIYTCTLVNVFCTKHASTPAITCTHSRLCGVSDSFSYDSYSSST